MRRKLQVAGMMLTVVVALAACSSNKASTTTTAKSTATTPTVAPTTAAPTTTTTKPGQEITITPSTGLTNDEVVSIKGSGYPPNEQQGITECANKGAQTGEGDCNIAGIAVTTASATGTVSATFKVVLGPFGANHIVCTNAPGCLVSVAQVGSADPNAVATEVIKFG